MASPRVGAPLGPEGKCRHQAGGRSSVSAPPFGAHLLESRAASCSPPPLGGAPALPADPPQACPHLAPPRSSGGQVSPTHSPSLQLEVPDTGRTPWSLQCWARGGRGQGQSPGVFSGCPNKHGSRPRLKAGLERPKDGAAVQRQGLWVGVGPGDQGLRSSAWDRPRKGHTDAPAEQPGVGLELRGFPEGQSWWRGSGTWLQVGGPRQAGQGRGRPAEAGGQRPAGCHGQGRAVVAGAGQAGAARPPASAAGGCLLRPAQFRAQKQSDGDPSRAQAQKGKSLPRVTSGSHSSLALPAVTLELGATCWSSSLLTRKGLRKT